MGKRGGQGYVKGYGQFLFILGNERPKGGEK